MTSKTQESSQDKPVLPVEDDSNSIPPEITEVLSELPEQQRKEVRRMYMAAFSMINRSSPEGDIAKKITSEHISSMLNAQEKGMDYAYKENQHRLIFFVVVLVVIVVAVVTIIALLKDSHPESMSQILTALISAALGAAGGYGIGSRNRNDN